MPIQHCALDLSLNWPEPTGSPFFADGLSDQFLSQSESFLGSELKKSRDLGRVICVVNQIKTLKHFN